MEKTQRRLVKKSYSKSRIGWCEIPPYIGCFLKCHLKVGVEESIVNAPFVSLQSKNTNNAKSEVRL
jgi:hypothetical protein